MGREHAADGQIIIIMAEWSLDARTFCPVLKNLRTYAGNKDDFGRSGKS